jgi:hypothetical protein
MQTYVPGIDVDMGGAPETGRYSRREAAALLARVFDNDAISRKRLPYERLDQLTVDLRVGL